MKKLLLIAALLSPATQACFLSHETTDGLNKICYYDCATGTKAITVSAASMCPMSLYREMRELMGLPCSTSGFVQS